jgi:hypothetical protein
MDKGFTHSGALARITHVETLAALALPKSGGIYDLGMELNRDIPHIPGFAKFSIAFTQTPEGTGKRTWPFQYSAESLFGALHVGTHMDALIHVQSAGRIFGGSQANEARDDSGWKEYGQETVGPIVGRAILLDVAAQKGVEYLADGYEITVEDIQQALEAAGQSVQNGDIDVGIGRDPGLEAPQRGRDLFSRLRYRDAA